MESSVRYCNHPERNSEHIYRSEECFEGMLYRKKKYSRKAIIQINW
jgi:hypothetical protein